MQALELLLDPETDDVVRREWAALHQVGLPSQADHRGETNAPHVTVFATEHLPATDIDLAAALSPLLPLPVRLGPAVAFPGRRVVVARLVVPDADLLHLHAAAVAASGAEPTPLTNPGRWVPHVSLARGIPTDRVGEALALLRAPGHDGTATRLRHWDSDARRATELT